jgi:uncharacterized protein
MTIQAHDSNPPAVLPPAISPLELDGYLTGVIVTPQPAPISPSDWMMRLWDENRPIFDDEVQIKAVLGALIKRYNAISTEINRNVRRLEIDGTVDYQPRVPSWKQKAHARQRENMGARLLEGDNARSRNMEQAR